MADEYGLPNTEEEFKTLIDELLGKVPDKKAQQADARQALSEIIGVDIDKLAALINNDATEQTDKQVEQEESETDLLRDDVFSAQDLNGLSDVYIAEELNIGAVVSIGGMEVFHILDCAHSDQAHTAWVDPMGRVMSDQVMARLAQDVNATNETTVVKIIHLG